jgi:hypothetical protein
MGLDLERHPCPWIISWVGQGEADGFRFEFGFAIFVQTRSIAILTSKVNSPVSFTTMENMEDKIEELDETMVNLDLGER